MPMMSIPYFDGTQVDVDDAGDDGALSEAEAVATLKAFLSLTPADRMADSPHVHAYYQDFHEAVGGEDWLDSEMGVPATPEAIWKHVTPTSIFLGKGRGEDRHCYVVVEGNCDWEQEHGLMMVWRNGHTLCKVGGYDGHLTNSGASVEDDRTDVVYDAIDQHFRTYLRI